MSLTASTTDIIARTSQEVLSALSAKAADIIGTPDQEVFSRTAHKYSDEEVSDEPAAFLCAPEQEVFTRSTHKHSEEEASTESADVLYTPNEEVLSSTTHKYSDGEISAKPAEVLYRPVQEVSLRTTRKYSDEEERLRIWLQEHDVASGGLDHRLRESSELRGRVLDLLAQLAGAVSEVPHAEPEFGRYQPSDPDSSSVPTPGPRILLPELRIRDDLSIGSTSLSLDTNATLPDSVSDSPLNRVHDIVSHLLELGPSILDPAPHDRIDSYVHSNAAQHDINHVRDSFPKAAEDLVVRLGRANWERRQYLVQLRSRLADSLSVGNSLRQIKDGDQEDVDKSDMSDATTNSETFVQDSGRSSKLPFRPIPIGDTKSDKSTFSRTDTSGFRFSRGDPTMTEVTTPSKADMLLSEPPPSDMRYKIPYPPQPNQELSGEAFTCPFCAHSVTGMKTASAWRKHIFGDLEAYLCTYPECMLSAKTYRSRRSWWHHEKERHRTQRAWICTPCESKDGQSVFETPASFDEHIALNHPVKLTRTQLASVRDACQRITNKHRPSSTCPLCQITIERNPAASFEFAVKKHISDHLEQLALFVALPAGSMLAKEDDSEFQDDSDSGDGLQTEIMSIVSRGTRVSKRDVQQANVKAFIADQQRAANDHGNMPIVHSESPTQRGSTMPSTSDALASAYLPSFPMLGPMPPPSEHFYSRDRLTSAIAVSLRSPGLICVIHGVGGVGKTLAAVQYSHNKQQDYDAVFWLQADTAPGLADSFVQMVALLGLSTSADDHGQAIAKGRNWLQETDKRWLLVFDNAHGLDDISRYFPQTVQETNGSVIITTHLENIIPEAPHVTKVQIDPLGQRAGSEMLLKYLGRDVRNDPERQLAMEISAFVGGLPVAIAHVAGYVSFSGYTLEELIETFREWRKRTGIATDERDDLPATFREASFSYDGTLAMVWEVTLRELTQDACDVLYILAFLNCAAVPQKMLWGIHEDPLLQFMDSRERIRMRRINESLIKRRLVDDADSCFSMHRSVQRGIRQKLSRDRSRQQKVFNQAVAVVREAFPRLSNLQQPRPEKWSELQKLLPHLHALRDVYRASKSQIQGSIDFAQLLLDAGMDQFEQGIAQEGLLLLDTSETVLDTLDTTAAISPEDHKVMKADIHALMGIMYDDIGISKRQEALERRKLALGIRREVSRDATTQQRKYEMLLFNSWMEYAISLLHYHRHEDANPIIESCLAKFKEWGPEDEIPFEYAKYFNKMALVKMYQGMFIEAVEHATKGAQLMEKTGYNMFASRFKFDLACITLQSGDLDRALQIHKEIYDHRIKLVGPTNQLSLHSMYAIGAIHELKNGLHEAEYWFRQVLDQPRSFSSWPDEAYARAQYHLGRVLLAQGRAEDADYANTMQESAREVLDRLLPLDMPPELEGVTDKYILFDHMLPVSPGGPRFTGKGLLERFLRDISTT